MHQHEDWTNSFFAFIYFQEWQNRSLSKTFNSVLQQRWELQLEEMHDLDDAKKENMDGYTLKFNELFKKQTKQLNDKSCLVKWSHHKKIYLTNTLEFTLFVFFRNS